MQELKFLLERFKHLVSTDAVLKQAFKTAVKRATGHEISGNEIKVQGWNIYLATTRGLRSEIFLKQEAIMSELEHTLKDHRVKKVI